jgi:DHA3 family macrolide efflux protein-like MFS transporter
MLLPVCTQIWHFYVILAAISLVSSFFMPAQGVVIREAVPLHGLRSSNALMQLAMFMMRIVGPATAGMNLDAVHQCAERLCGLRGNARAARRGR